MNFISNIASKVACMMCWCACVTTCFAPIQLQAGAYIFSGEALDIDIVTHPNTYTGSGGNIIVRVCINPSSPNALAMEIPVQNNIQIYNDLLPTRNNLKWGSANNIPSNQVDFESVALHEIGHCLGMAHVNAASESNLLSPDIESTKATDGVNNLFDINSGTDGVTGSSDDLRGDDVNLHWFRMSNNDPFTIDSIVDETTYSVSVSDLPPIHNFAANASRDVSNLLGYGANTEAVMQQGTDLDEAQRTLTHDDVATLKYAASGVDEESGSSDDYTITLEYGGISSSNCDISLSITSTDGLAFCSVNGAYVGQRRERHVRVTDAYIEFGSGFSWFFNTESINQPPDADSDGVPDSNDNCPNNANPLQENNDGDSQGDVCDPDDDNDGLTDVDEGSYGTDPFLMDTDGDNLGDYQEVTTYLTDPTLADTDSDGLDDGDEVNNWSTNPLASNRGDVGPRLAPDNMLNASDLVVLTRLVTGIITPVFPEDILGDINDDSQINAADLLLLQQLILNTP